MNTLFPQRNSFNYSQSHWIFNTYAAMTKLYTLSNTNTNKHVCVYVILIFDVLIIIIDCCVSYPNFMTFSNETFSNEHIWNVLRIARPIENKRNGVIDTRTLKIFKLKTVLDKKVIEDNLRSIYVRNAWINYRKYYRCVFWNEKKNAQRNLRSEYWFSFVTANNKYYCLIFYWY